MFKFMQVTSLQLMCLLATVAILCPQQTLAGSCPEGVPTVWQPDSHMDTQIITATALTNKTKDKPFHSTFLLIFFQTLWTIVPDVNFKTKAQNKRKQKEKALPEKTWLYQTVKNDGRLIGTAGRWRLCGLSLMLSALHPFFFFFFNYGGNSGYGRTRIGQATTTSLIILCPDSVWVHV